MLEEIGDDDRASGWPQGQPCIPQRLISADEALLVADELGATRWPPTGTYVLSGQGGYRLAFPRRQNLPECISTGKEFEIVLETDLRQRRYLGLLAGNPLTDYCAGVWFPVRSRQLRWRAEGSVLRARVIPMVLEVFLTKPALHAGHSVSRRNQFPSYRTWPSVDEVLRSLEGPQSS